MIHIGISFQKNQNHNGISNYLNLPYKVFITDSAIGSKRSLSPSPICSNLSVNIEACFTNVSQYTFNMLILKCDPIIFLCEVHVDPKKNGY